MNRLFIADTPFQVFNCLNYALNTQQDGIISDIVIINQFKIAEKLYTNLTKTNLFHNLALLEKERARKIENNTLRRVKVALDLLFSKHTLTSHLQKGTLILKNNYYQEVYFSCTTHVVSSLIKCNLKATVNLIDDGTGSYNGDITKTSNAKYEKLMSFVSSGATSKRANTLYVNNIKLCHSKAADRICSMPMLNETFTNLANQVFEYQNVKEEENKKVVFLTQPYTGGLECCIENIKEVLSILKTYEKNTYVRMHPRDTKFEYYEGFYLDKAEHLWELKSAQTQMKESVLISLYSTAQFNPNMLFGIEPVLVFIFKLCPHLSQATKEGWEAFINEFRKNYTHPERIYIPETLEQLKQIIEKYK